MDMFLDLAGRVMLRFTPSILIAVAVLPCLSYTGDREDTLTCMYIDTVKTTKNL